MTSIRFSISASKVSSPIQFTGLAVRSDNGKSGSWLTLPMIDTVLPIAWDWFCDDRIWNTIIQIGSPPSPSGTHPVGNSIPVYSMSRTAVGGVVGSIMNLLVFSNDYSCLHQRVLLESPRKHHKPQKSISDSWNLSGRSPYEYLSENRGGCKSFCSFGIYGEPAVEIGPLGVFTNGSDEFGSEGPPTASTSVLY